jgi:hypothetical protein
MRYEKTYGQIAQDAKKAGRPPLEPRIAAIELTNKAHQSWTEDIALKLLAIDKLNAELLERLQSLELRFKDYRIAQSQTAQQLETMAYKPLFEHWPGQSER